MNIIERIKNILTTPKTEWDVINNEEASLGGLIGTYMLPLALVSSVCAFIGYGLLWHPVLFGVSFGATFGISYGIRIAVIRLISSILSVVITTYVVDLLAPSFASEKNLNKSAQLVVYSYTAGLLGSFLAIYPPIGIIGSLFGLYGIYILYLGMPKLKKTPEDKVLIYILATAGILIVVSILLGMILGGLLIAGTGLSTRI